MPISLDTLKGFKLDRVLSESTLSGSVFVLGHLDDETAILHLQRTVLPTEKAERIVSSLEDVNFFLENQPYYSAHGVLPKVLDGVSLPDLVIKVICPATETHIKKYTAQERKLVVESPEKYEKVVVPYIESFPPSRIEWVYNILDGVKEAERVVHLDKDPETGFVLVPDLKWDQTSMKALYLTVLVQNKSIRSLRDLSPDHLPLLNKIRDTTRQVVKDRFGVEKDKIRLFVHYQPSYYHFHVHVVHIDHEGLAGMTVGQAHLLDDLISLLDLSAPSPEPSIIAKMTFTYALGVEHGLYPALAGAPEDDT